MTSRYTTLTHARSVPHDTVMAQMFREDSDFAQACFDVALEEGSLDDVLILMRQMALACGGVAEVARRAGLHEKSLHRTLSRRGNPRWTTMQALFKAMGLQFSVSVQRHAA